MTNNDWMATVETNWDDLVYLINRFHPASKTKTDDHYEITANKAEKLSEAFRKEIEKGSVISPFIKARDAKQNKDMMKLYGVLSETWFGMPESTAVHIERGFDVLCNLLDDAPDE